MLNAVQRIILWTNFIATVGYGNGAGVEQSRMLPVVMCKEGKGEFNALETEEFGLFCTGDSCSTDGQYKTKWRAGSSSNSQL